MKPRLKYNPHQHHRRSIRLKGYDYSLAEAYFITVVTRRHGLLLGEIVTGEMHLNGLGRIANECWQEIPDHFPNVEAEPFVVMPNHIHGVITILDEQWGCPKRRAAPFAFTEIVIQ